MGAERIWSLLRITQRETVTPGMCLESFKLSLQLLKYLLSVFRLPTHLQRITADHIAAPAKTIFSLILIINLKVYTGGIIKYQINGLLLFEAVLR